MKRETQDKRHLMKKLIILLALLATPCFAQDIDFGDRALYWCSQNGHTNIVRLSQAFHYAPDGQKGSLSYIAWSAQSWKIGSPPSKATLTALDTATVQAWKADTIKDKEADPDQMEDQTKAIVKALVKVINLRLPAGNKITAPELKAAIKDEL